VITLVEALNYRCLRRAGHSLRRFNVLVGPNASGKTTFLDVISFLGDLVSHGPDGAISSRTDNIYDMFTGQTGESFELAIEAALPESIQQQVPLTPAEEAAGGFPTIRYAVRIGVAQSGERGILGERLALKSPAGRDSGTLFPLGVGPVYSKKSKPERKIIHKIEGRNDNFYTEVNPHKGKGWIPSFKFGPSKSALGNLPDDGRRFPAASWFKDYLENRITVLTLNSLLIRKPCPPGRPRHLMPDGSNLPWVIDRLKHEAHADFEAWLSHIRTALPDIAGIDTKLKEEDRHRYLVVTYASGTSVPSWFVSDGTLRFLALTILAYVSDTSGTFLIEEPENGLHPPAIEPLFQSFSSMYGSQALIATHSSVALGQVDVADVLCFSRENEGTEIVAGDMHPALREWKGEVNLGTLIASGILG
jgi:predicted ATPase